MTLKQVNEIKKINKKDVIKKDVVSSSRIKDNPIKKKTKESAVSKRIVKSKKTVSKNLESKLKVKTVKVNPSKPVLKTKSIKKKIIKKSIPNLKKISTKKSIDKKEKFPNIILEEELCKQESVTTKKCLVNSKNTLLLELKTIDNRQKEEYISNPQINIRSKNIKNESPKDTKKYPHENLKKTKTIQETPFKKHLAVDSDDYDLIIINELTTVKELADNMRLNVGDVLKKLLLMGSLATINQKLDPDVATILANEFGYDTKFSSIYSKVKIDVHGENLSKLKARPPVVTIMGHVDHGKTSLLDVIRSSNIVAGEHGGITQHIGAYKVKIKIQRGEEYIAFLDTPGHEAFTAMRSRGVKATDIIILVVSASDGVMPQTIEAINHAKIANVPIIVAVNKIDLPTANSKKIRQELSGYGLVPEEWGGDVIMVDISAKQRINIDLLLEMILLKAEMMELKSDPDKNAEGIVVEAKLDSRRGPVVTLLVQSGTLKVGDNIVIGTTYGRVRAMIDEYGKRFDAAFPSTPVEILGISALPQVGDKFIVVDYESRAKEIAQSRKIKIQETSSNQKRHLSLADINSGRTKDLRIILKTDVQGSLGALSDSLERLSTSNINLKIIHKAAGAITASDVALAVASDALIIGFNLRPDTTIEKLISNEGVSINIYRIIYDLIADIKAAMEGMLKPDVKEKIIGKAVVKHVFKLSTYGTISGCLVIEGKIKKDAKARLLRDNIIVFDGNISSLKRFKNDVREVEKGYECGIGLEKFSDIKIDDIIENFVIEK
ncbi:MAG: translation initiation factor IF-2 [Endomicrobium sp.]|jgi:translation initiation factor IF-2|nr:translation initiation factor IF-2 [Endomicrobium sp.]